MRACTVLALSWLAACLAAYSSACLEPTPFGVNPSQRDLTRRNLNELEDREAALPIKFVALGDIHNDLDDLARTVDAINQRDDVSFVAIVGDMSDYGLVQEFEWVHQQLGRLHVPYLTVIGNHDALSSGKDIYREMFGPFDYAFRHGGIAFVFYNSNSLEFPGEPVPDYAWLEAQLQAAADADGVVLVTHCPPGGEVGNGGVDPALAPLLREHDVRLYVHSHLEEHRVWQWERTPILQCGTFEVGRFHTVVTLDGATVSFEQCRFERCEPVERPGACEPP